MLAIMQTPHFSEHSPPPSGGYTDAGGENHLSNLSLVLRPLIVLAQSSAG